MINFRRIKEKLKEKTKKYLTLSKV